jgi:putative ABC transport system permease protein
MFRRKRKQNDFNAEVEAHLALEADRLKEQGMNDEEARMAARRTFGNVTRARERFYESNRWRGWDNLRQDARYGLRQLRRNPGFTFVAVLTLALGIGVNTAAFTIVNTLLLNPLAIRNAQNVVAIETEIKTSGNASSRLQFLSLPNLVDLRERNRVFSSVTGYSYPTAVTLSNGPHAERIFAELVTPDYFRTLEIPPFLGRFFLPEETDLAAGRPVAVLTYKGWQGRFGGAADIIGHTVRINAVVFTIVGVAPRGFDGVNAVFGPDLWVPAAMEKQLFPMRPDWRSQRAEPVVRVAGRLKPGTTFAEAQAQMNVLAKELKKVYPEANRGYGIALEPIENAALGGAGSHQQLILASALLMAIVGLVLLVACSNVANLLMARAAARRQEMAVRKALGAGRIRLARQMITESVLLGLASGFFGFGFGYLGCKTLWSFRPAEFAQNLAEPRLNATVLIFTLAVSLLTGAIFGLMPAIVSSRSRVAEALKEESPKTGRSRRSLSFGNILVAAQVALSLVALITAGLCLRSVARESTIDPGFQTRRLALFLLYPGQTGYNRARTEQFYRQVREQVSALPGVMSVSWATNLPLWGRQTNGVVIKGREPQPKSLGITSILNTVGLDYFTTIGVPILQGRAFTRDDREGSAPVAIINDTMARQYWPGQDPLGKLIKLPDENSFRRIVGVAKTANYQTLGEQPQPCIYIPLRQNLSGSMVLYLRTSKGPSLFLPTVQRELRSIDPLLPVEDVRTGQTVINQALWSGKIGAGLLAAFGLLALSLACVGLYGIMAYSVNQRRHEIGLRMALGAAPRSISRLILRQGMTLACAGVAAGLAASLAVGHVLAGFLYGVGGVDPLTFIVVSLILITVALAACYIPARRAARVDPMVALRYE